MAKLPETARAALMFEYNEDLRVAEVGVPQPDPGALVVKVDITSVCGSDVHTWHGAVKPRVPIKPPLVLGHETVGTVVAIGVGADTDSTGNPIRIGDRVIWENAACRRCEACTVLHQPTLCFNRQVGMLHDATVYPYTAGGFAEYSYVWPNAGRVRVPDKLPSEYAAAGSCALRTVVNAFERVGRIDTTSRVVIQGAGPLGLFATALASRFNPRQLVVVGAPASRLEVAKQWGATDAISVEDYKSADDRVAVVEEITGGGADVLFEMSGARGAFAEGVRMAGIAGRYMVVGTLGGPAQEVEAMRVATRQLTIMGTMSAEIGSYQRALEFLAGGMETFDWNALFSDRRYSLAEATEALTSLETMQEIKPLVVPSV
ncbi:zinc-binding dehydrogenase [Rhodococcus opacus]|uniref:zinc-binding dehydrogenase n=1 Tax=Rhodococcus opacus TaxID=37919 RepID=UPI002473A605|nr:zinc-binding dehydrogenase [Rhodococcus opacus]MDH6293304.1 L-iditol 2-dehydrogenase [Rhodococcus opacus]